MVTTVRINKMGILEYEVNNFYCKSAWPAWSNYLIKSSFVKIRFCTLKLFEETGSEQQLESDRDVCSHPPSSTHFWKGS